ncbi:hypothetical protein Cni_G20455 [Canna indica]|uniref:Uncharacterized protein n=1 Tax=Canna indica TaxID=4628 RepID=A0AAQ3QG86_9LILI|nr:hypothetical protein Cni_G20455 [Canna indica]
MDEFHLQEQLSFLNDPTTPAGSDHSLPIGPKSVVAGGGSNLFYPDLLCRSPTAAGTSYCFLTEWDGGQWEPPPNEAGQRAIVSSNGG